MSLVTDDQYRQIIQYSILFRALMSPFRIFFKLKSQQLSLLYENIKEFHENQNNLRVKKCFSQGKHNVHFIALALLIIFAWFWRHSSLVERQVWFGDIIQVN